MRVPSTRSRASLLATLRDAPPAIPPSVLDVLAQLQSAGHQAFLAGGCVRDAILGRTPDDFDVATSARPEQVVALFRRVVPTGLQHGTVTVVSSDDGEARHIEVTTFRGEGEYLDGRRPESVFFLDDVDGDLARRDFTMNAMAWDPVHAALRDPFGGVGDLARRRIRAVGDPVQRFSEDGLRPLRAVRFASIFGFGLESETARAIPATRDTFRKVAMERVRDELTKLLLRSPKPSRGLSLLLETGLLSDIAPELLESIGFVQNRWHRWDVWEHTLRVVDATPPRLVVRLAALLHDIAKPRCAENVGPGEHTFYKHEFVGADVTQVVLERLRYPRKVIDAVAHQVREHNWFYRPEWNDGTVRRHLAQVGPEALEDFFALREADIRGRGRAVQSGLANVAELRSRFAHELARASALSIRDLAVGGGDLMKELGLPPGPNVGETLRALLQHVLDHPDANTRGALLERARAIVADLAAQGPR